MAACLLALMTKACSTLSMILASNNRQDCAVLPVLAVAPCDYLHWQGVDLAGTDSTGCEQTGPQTGKKNLT